ncbi:hypothetical protein, partial [Stenotrophomonas sp.]|uniref:hypothetical protein n=1 Tax=Stenotrophomonas sp. TaxID=69392 RepID=UPI002FCB4477
DDEGALEDRIGSDDPAAWPNRLRRLHGVRQVGEALYAVGAGRQVHRRALAAGGWTRHDHGCRVVAGSGDASSFHDLHGRDDDELLAVGSQGALWRWNGGQWRALAGHGEAPLHAVQYTGNGYLATGSAGTVLRIDQDQVQPLAHAHTGETFCGIAQAFGTVYLCSEAGGLFRLDDHTVSALDIDADPDGGGHLAGSEDGLLWVTAARVRRLDHGGWHDITPD